MPQNNRVKATLILRNDTASEWFSKNPILALGEIGAENDTGLLKLGDGLHRFNDLDYINSGDIDENLVTKVNNKLTVANYGKSYWTYSSEDGQEVEVEETDLTQWPQNLALEVKNGIARWVESKITYLNSQGKIICESITLGANYNPANDEDVSTKKYVDVKIAQAIVNAPHLKRLIVNELPVSNIQADTIYMVKDTTASGDDKYREYLLIDNELAQIGDTSPDLSNYLQKLNLNNYTPGHSLALNNEGELIDSGYNAAPPALTVATFSALGGVKSSTNPNEIQVNSQGFMSLNSVATDLLYVPNGSTFIINGGNATA